MAGFYRASVADPLVLVFAKYPHPGLVKTRLVPALTPEQAAAIHLACLRAVCELVEEATGVGPTLVVTPDEQLDAMKKELAGFDLQNSEPRALARADSPFEYWPQGEGTLGDRLARAVNRAFDESHTSVILLGADSPTTPSSFVRQACHRLQTHDAILGPCVDGGYYLLGLSQPCDAIFQNIDWGTEQVAGQTRERAAGSDLTLFELPEWYDVDRFDDLRRTRADLAALKDSGRTAAAALRNLLEELMER